MIQWHVYITKKDWKITFIIVVVELYIKLDYEG